MPPPRSRRDALKLLGGAAVALSAAPLAGCAPAVLRPRAARRPNVVFIMTDDHAQSALGIYGNRILKTPNLDRIGHEGVRFDLGFVTNSLCLPSRATFLTGQYSHIHGMRTNGAESGFTEEPPLDNAQTWPILLGNAGYHTGVVGKWHVNTPPAGYDHSAILRGQGVYFDPEILVNGRSTWQQGHTDDVIGAQALQFLSQRPKDRPFALLYQFKAPHGNWEPAPRFEGAFDDVEIPVPDSLLASDAGRPYGVRMADLDIAGMGDFRDQVDPSLPEDERARRNYGIFIRRYYSVLLGVDENVGRLLDALDAEGLAEDTIIVYTSDNGFFLGENGWFDKRLMYEPSIRVPMLMRWPGGIAPMTVHALRTTPSADAGGPTHAQNLQGQCERCNYTKDLPGWRAATHSRGDPPSGHDGLPGSRGDPPSRRTPAFRPPEVVTTTPTGHSYRSPPPTLPRVG